MEMHPILAKIFNIPLGVFYIVNLLQSEQFTSQPVASLSNENRVSTRPQSSSGMLQPASNPRARKSHSSFPATAQNTNTNTEVTRLMTSFFKRSWFTRSHRPLQAQTSSYTRVFTDADSHVCGSPRQQQEKRLGLSLELVKLQPGKQIDHTCSVRLQRESCF